MLSPRIKRLSEKVRDTQATICLDRARLITEFYSQPSMEPTILRRARSFEYVLDHRKIFIDDDSIMAGNLASRFHAVPCFPENTAWLRTDLDDLDTRESDHFEFMPGEKEELRQITEKWKGRTFQEMTDMISDDETEAMIDAGVFTKGICSLSTMCNAPDYPELVNKGYRYYIDLCKENIAKNKNTTIEKMESIITWKSMIIVLEALIRHAHRYADLAEEQSKTCEDPERRSQLITMAENLRVVPEYPAQNFLQAAQLVWFTHMALMLEVNSRDHCIGRFDQYMLPFYKKDIAAGVSEQFLEDVVQEFKLKIAEMWILLTNKESSAYPGNPLWIHLMLGGVKPDGTDGCNEVTRLVLHCMDDLQTKEPCVSFRYHENIDPETFKLALDVAKKGGSHPAFFGDETSIHDLLNLGHTLEEARDWGICGCIEPSVPGMTDFQSNVGYFNPIKVFEIMMNDGFDPVSKKQLGPHTGDVRTFTTIEQFQEAYKKQQDFFMDHFIEMYNRIISLHAHTLPTITGSIFTHDCIERGRVLQRRGARYFYSAAAVTCIANVADSFAAIEECVLNKKYITMDQLMDLLATDFEGKENLRQMLINRAPKYGNNEEAVDKYAHWVVKLCNDEVKKYKDGRGGEFTIVVSSQSYNVVLGHLVGATPDGRKAYTALADNASPMIGMDVNGPTEALHSITSLDPMMVESGILVNQRFDPVFVKGEKGSQILDTVMRTYFKNHGQHIQINVVDDETLRAAQKNPQDYKNILVRVAGYSAYFVDLEKEMQDNIIARTLQQKM